MTAAEADIAYQRAKADRDTRLRELQEADQALRRAGVAVQDALMLWLKLSREEAAQCPKSE